MSATLPNPNEVSAGPVEGAEETAARLDTKKANRAREKCDRCRKKKVKCLPAKRDFEAGRRCDRCIKSRRPCGPNTRIRRGSVNVVEPDSRPTSSANHSVQIHQDDPSPHSNFTLDSSSRSPEMPVTYTERQPSASASTSVAFDKAKRQLRNMGDLIILYRFVQFRRQSVSEMVKALPVQDVSDFTSALEAFSWETGKQISELFRRIERGRSSLTAMERELISRRLVDTAQIYINNKTSEELCDVPEIFQAAFMSVCDELAKYYDDQGDHTEAVRFLSQHTTCRQSSAHYSDEGLKGLCQRISDAVSRLLNGVFPKHRKLLNDEEPVIINSGHILLAGGHDEGKLLPSDLGADNELDFTGRNTCQLAAEVGNREYLVSLSRYENYSQCLKARDKFSLTALMIAAYTGCIEVFAFLVETGADVWEQASNGRDSLCLASVAGHAAIVNYILQRVPRPAAKMCVWSPLHDAAATNHLQVAEILVSHGFNPQEEHSKYSRYTPIKVASENGHRRLAIYLEQAGCNRMKQAHHPLHLSRSGPVDTDAQAPEHTRVQPSIPQAEPAHEAPAGGDPLDMVPEYPWMNNLLPTPANQIFYEDDWDEDDLHNPPGIA